LDKIKSAAAASTTTSVKSKAEEGSKQQEAKQTPQWNALKEDFMLDSKKVRGIMQKLAIQDLFGLSRCSHDVSFVRCH
jgi:hypothetical protein